jgi:hypothetical protein
MRKIILVLVGTLLLASCVDIESRLALRGDGSGTLVIAYSISRQLADLGRTGADAPAVPLPVEREDFQRALSGVQGVRLASFWRSQNELEVSIRAEIAFASLEALARIEVLQEMQVRVEQDGGRRTLRMRVAPAAAKALSEDSLAMVDQLFEGRGLTFVVQAPAPVVSSGPGGQVSADRRTVTWTARMRDLVALPEDLVYSVTW